MKKKVLYVDLDDVVVDYSSAAKVRNVNKNTKNFFFNMKPLPGAIEAVRKLSDGYDVYFLSTAPWTNTHSWSEKRLWVENYFGLLAFKKLILTHNKSLMKGYCLIDNSSKNGAAEFDGLFIKFGSDEFPNWETVLNFLL